MLYHRAGTTDDPEPERSSAFSRSREMPCLLNSKYCKSQNKEGIETRPRDEHNRANGNNERNETHTAMTVYASRPYLSP